MSLRYWGDAAARLCPGTEPEKKVMPGSLLASSLALL